MSMPTRLRLRCCLPDLPSRFSLTLATSALFPLSFLREVPLLVNANATDAVVAVASRAPPSPIKAPLAAPIHLLRPEGSHHRSRSPPMPSPPEALPMSSPPEFLKSEVGSSLGILCLLNPNHPETARVEAQFYVMVLRGEFKSQRK
ncbi:uncharacterized protein LOC108957770 isoform X2 [Eucalyptus grandis]|uniref:uncharacterized protein LOC108957770 isoform X2 n=1 Tax=Eucalyptus grandis TaxID=71139 RepID=UPI00192EDCB9|nr:uncharacterized protein LOC108957770 isoform X2 [Eucalyptus grandis]